MNKPGMQGQEQGQQLLEFNRQDRQDVAGEIEINIDDGHPARIGHDVVALARVGDGEGSAGFNVPVGVDIVRAAAPDNETEEDDVHGMQGNRPVDITGE